MISRQPEKIVKHGKSAFDKYRLYVNSVQSAEHDAELILKIARQAMPPAKPQEILLREDFCGTGALCFEWVKLSKNHYAEGIDLDGKALAWGEDFFGKDLNDAQTKRVNLINDNVLNQRSSKPDVICALNFSYYFMQDRKSLRNYFQSCYDSLNSNGILILDSFGGPGYQTASIDRRRNSDEKFTYWWEIASFDALTHRIKCRIHYKIDRQKIRKNVFTYDWRLWSVPELRDILQEVGFSVHGIWSEGLTKSGHGNGLFRQITKETNCDTWFVYIVAKKNA